MKVSRKSVPKALVVTRGKDHRVADIAGILCFAVAILAVFCLVSGDSGLLGGALKGFMNLLFGQAAWAVPVALGLAGFSLLRGRAVVTAANYLVAIVLLFLCLSGFLAIAINGTDYLDATVASTSGGYIGGLIATMFTALFGGAKVVGFVTLGLVGVVLCLNQPLRAFWPKKRPKVYDEDEEDEPSSVRSGPSKLSAESKKELFGRGKASRSSVYDDLETETGMGGKAVVTEPIMRTRPAPIIRDRASENRSEVTLNTEVQKEGYQLPPMSLLNPITAKAKRNQQEMQKNIETLEGTLEQFGIDANVVEVATGPTVTRYEIQLGPGIRVARIAALADNIAMDLAASQVRVEAPIPGKAAIGVEVPNASSTMVTLRELIESKEFSEHPSRLCVALGQDVSGVNKYADLTRMPHLLIGGATNSGKSIGLATIITSLLMRNTPKEVRLVLIDPKRVELTLFDGIPHLMCPVIKDVKEAPGVLRAVWREMDRRYEMFSEKGVRNIDGWNAKAETYQDRLSYIVVVIDELADLMIQAAAEVETTIVRLAQLARAVGIHLVIATQRPSVDVITGIIKANIPSRIAFSVASQIDSRTIIDGKGAENLIGRGDMLFQPIDAMKPIRVQGCYVSEKEIEDVCNFWRNQEGPNYVLEPVAEIADSKKEGGDFGDNMDALWEDAVRWAVERGEASTSMLQRKFSIGFQRASRILDQMEERAIVGPRDGPRPRDVLISPMEVDALFGKGERYNVGRTMGDGLEDS